MLRGQRVSWGGECSLNGSPVRGCWDAGGHCCLLLLPFVCVSCLRSSPPNPPPFAGAARVTLYLPRLPWVWPQELLLPCCCESCYRCCHHRRFGRCHRPRGQCAAASHPPPRLPALCCSGQWAPGALPGPGHAWLPQGLLRRRSRELHRVGWDCCSHGSPFRRPLKEEGCGPPLLFDVYACMCINCRCGSCVLSRAC